jgi:hypothetical protein
MLKTELLAFSFCLPLLFSCASHSDIANTDRSLNNPSQIQKPQGTNYVPNYYFGFIIQQSKDGILIAEIPPYDGNNPAKVAGLQVGDVIVSANGKKLTAGELCRNVFFGNSGQDILFRINRNGQMVDCIITPRLFEYLPPITKKITELLSCENRNKVSIAVIVLEAKDNASFFLDAVSQYDWEKSLKYGVQGIMEDHLLSVFGGNNYFSLVDRLNVDKILEEYKFIMTGLISEEARVKIGKMTGATHLITITYQRTKKNDSCAFNVNARLIDIESGEILAVNKDNSDCK